MCTFRRRRNSEHVSLPPPPPTSTACHRDSPCFSFLSLPLLIAAPHEATPSSSPIETFTALYHCRHPHSCTHTHTHTHTHARTCTHSTPTHNACEPNFVTGVLPSASRWQYLHNPHSAQGACRQLVK